VKNPINKKVKMNCSEKELEGLWHIAKLEYLIRDNEIKPENASLVLKTLSRVCLHLNYRQNKLIELLNDQENPLFKFTQEVSEVEAFGSH